MAYTFWSEDSPVSWVEIRRTIFPKTCAVTGERIGWFTKVHRRITEVEYRGEVYTNTVEWISDAGWLWLCIKEPWLLGLENLSS